MPAVCAPTTRADGRLGRGRTRSGVKQPIPSRHRTSMAASACQENAVVFSNHQGNKLSGTLRLPTTQQAPVVILCHGYAGHRNDCILPRLAAELSTAGLASLRFDYAGNGESEGTFEVGNYWEEVEDIRAAKEHLEQVHGLRVLGVVGHSKAGDNVLLYASKYDDIPLVVNLAGRLHMAAGIQSRYGENILAELEQGPRTITVTRNDRVTFKVQLSLQDLQTRLSLDMAAAAKAIRRSKVLTVHGTNDAIIPITDGREFAALIQGSQLVEVEGGDHNFKVPEHAAAAVEAIVSFVVANKAACA